MLKDGIVALYRNAREGALLLTRDETLMGTAIEQAKLAALCGEVPVGALVCRGGEIISLAYNRRETDKNALAHAELLVLDAACRALGGWRLFDCELFVTLEPCPMCAGAIINARVKRVVFGARDPKAGCFGSVTDFNSLAFNHRPEIVPDIRGEECAALLKDFFAGLRK